MEWREALDEARTEDALQALWDQTQASRNDLLQALAQSIDQHPDAAQAVSHVRALMFVERFAEEVQSHLDRI
jgi:molecular chaperone HscB